MRRRLVWHPRRQAAMVDSQPISQLASLSGGGGQIVTTATKVVLKPLEDRIVVRPLEAEQTTASGLVIPDTAKEKPQEGEVLAVGPGRFDDAGAKRVPMDVEVGNIERAWR